MANFTMLQEMERLHALGFAIHWLKPNSKMPLESKWTTGPRKTLEQLRAQYKGELNMGVRLGTPSKVGSHFLAVIDCDVKSTKPKHFEEMAGKVREIFGELLSPIVLSGRGNGSQHIYIKTEQPARSRRLAQSGEKVKVKMPSVPPSKHELATLSKEDIAGGWRLRAAWEISIMGDGAQVVLPPSIHPDSGRAYTWQLGVAKSGAMQVVQLPEANAKAGLPGSVVEDWAVVEVDLVSSALPERIFQMIVTGEGVEDRSASLMTACRAMVKAGFKREEILTVLTDKDNFLASAGYDHAQTNSRKRAAAWVDKYTLRKATEAVSSSLAFKNSVEESENDERELENILRLEEAHALGAPVDKDWDGSIEEAELAAEDKANWRLLLDRTSEKSGAHVKATLKNIVLIITNVVDGAVFSRNLFSNRDAYTSDTPWGGKKGAAIKDEDTVIIKLWLANRYNIEPSTALISEAITIIAMENAYHPVRDYLNGLEWDGVPRIDTWLKMFMQASGPEPYLSTISRKVLVAMVARVMEPGCKFDHVLIMEGAQGIGKSSAGRILAGSPWFCDTLPDIKDKDAMLNLMGAWVVEISELATLRKSDSESYKAFLSKQADRVRAPYGERWVDHARQCVFIGTTNASFYLKDRTGNRRFWPVEVGQCDFAGLEKIRDQLFAEAMLEWGLGEKLYLEGVAKKQSEEIQGERVGDDEESAMADDFEQYVLRSQSGDVESLGQSVDLNGNFRLMELFQGDGPWAKYKQTGYYFAIAGSVLKKAGFIRRLVRGKAEWKNTPPVPKK